MKSAPRQLLKLAQVPILGTVAAALNLATASLEAQSADTIPLVASIQEAHLVLPSPAGETLVKYSVSGSTVFLFPIYRLFTAQEYAGGNYQPFVDAGGIPQIPPGATQLPLTITLVDLLRDPAIYSLVTNGVAGVQGVPSGSIFTSPGISGGRPAKLILRDPNNHQHVTILDQTDSLTGGEITLYPKANFIIGSSGLKLLRAGPIPVTADSLEIQVDQQFRARFQTTDLLVSLNSVEQALNQVHRRLASTPDGRSAGLLLSPKVPVGATQSGTIEAYNDLQTALRRNVQIEVIERQDASVDPNLALRFVDQALSNAIQQHSLDLQISSQERDNAVATLLLDDGLSVTLPLGHLDEVAASITENSNSQWSSAFTQAQQSAGTYSVSANVSVDGGFFSRFAGGSGNFNQNQSWSDSSYVHQKLNSFSQYLSDTSARIKGNVPYLTGIRFNVDGSVQNLNVTDIQQSLSTFTNGLATLTTSRSLSEAAGSVGAAQTYQAIRVPQILSGQGSAYNGSSQTWTVWGGGGHYKSTQHVTFQTPFAGIPTVFVAISHLDTPDDRETRIWVFPNNIDANGFDLNLDTWADSFVAGVTASWLAYGERTVTPTAGLPGTSNGHAWAQPISSADLAWAATPQIAPIRRGNDGSLAMSFNSLPGTTYAIEASTNLKQWFPVQSLPAFSFSTALSIIPGNGPHEFYRILSP